MPTAEGSQIAKTLERLVLATDAAARGRR
jgi:hypothetical protein